MVAARGGWWCATDVFTVHFQTAAFPFFRLFFLYLSSPLGRLTAHSPGRGSLGESPHMGPGAEPWAAPATASSPGTCTHRLALGGQASVPTALSKATVEKDGKVHEMRVGGARGPLWQPELCSAQGEAVQMAFTLLLTLK